MITDPMPRIHPGRLCPPYGHNGLVRGLSAPLLLAAARGRRHPGRWLLPALGIALAVAFAAGVAAESQIAADQSARSVLQATSPLDSEVRVTWQGPVTPAWRTRRGPCCAGLIWGRRPRWC